MRLDSRTALPYSFVTSRQLFPIQPSPALVATVLWGAVSAVRHFVLLSSLYWHMR